MLQHMLHYAVFAMATSMSLSASAAAMGFAVVYASSSGHFFRLICGVTVKLQNLNLLRPRMNALPGD